MTKALELKPLTWEGGDRTRRAMKEEVPEQESRGRLRGQPTRLRWDGEGLRRESGVEARNGDQLLHLITEEKDPEIWASGWGRS